MKTTKTILMLGMIFLISLSFTGCTHDDAPEYGPVDPGVGESATELLVKKFSTAPTFGGDKIDEVWSTARPLVNAATVSKAGDRIITLNGSSNFDTTLEPTDLMDPYTDEIYKYSLRGGYDDTHIYLLFEWEDDTDSQDRQSWFFDGVSSTWKQENKYANHKNDKFYEDKFGMMFPVADASKAAAGFAGGTCTVTCHDGLALKNDDALDKGTKVTRHYMENQAEIVDFWHWKRDRHALAEACDDGFIDYPITDGVDHIGKASANGRRNDAGQKPYGDNQTFTDAITGMKGPLYVMPGKENYYWIVKSEIGTLAKEVTAIALDGTLTYDGGGTISPAGDPAYSQGFGNKRIPSVIINPAGQGNDGRSEVRILAKHTGSGWRLEIKRLLETGDPEHDVSFSPGQSIPFGLAIFNNAAIGHAQSNYLTMKIE